MCRTRSDLSYEIDSRPKTKTDYLNRKSVPLPHDGDGGGDGSGGVPRTRPSGETPGVPRAGIKYPVRENPSLRSLLYRAFVEMPHRPL